MDINCRRIVGELRDIVADAAIETANWQHFSDRFRELLPGTKTLFLVNDLKGSSDIPLIHSGFEDSVIRDFGAYYGGINCWGPFNRFLPLLKPRQTEDFLPSSSFRNTEFYADFLQHLPDTDAGTAVRLLADRDRSAEFAVHYSAKHNERINRLVEPVLNALAPAMSQALSLLRVRMVKDHRSSHASIAQAMLDPAFVLTTGGRVLETNQAGQALANEATLLRIGPSDRLEISDPEIAQEVAKSIGRAERREAFVPGSETIRLQHSSGQFSIALYPLSFQLPADRFQLLLPAQGSVLLIVRPLATIEPNHAEILRKRFGLTVAEARLALMIARGSPLSEASQTLRISYQTGRTHMKAIFAKLNIRRQAELVALLLPLISDG